MLLNLQILDIRKYKYTASYKNFEVVHNLHWFQYMVKKVLFDKFLNSSNHKTL